MSELRSEIRRNLSRYLRREIELRDFEDWFIAEYSYGDRTGDSLREELAASIPQSGNGPSDVMIHQPAIAPIQPVRAFDSWSNGNNNSCVPSEPLRGWGYRAGVQRDWSSGDLFRVEL